MNGLEGTGKNNIRKGKEGREELAKLTDLHGIDQALLERLGDMGICSLDALRRNGANGAGSLRVSLYAGVEKKRIEKLVTQADLMRLRGIGAEYARRLMAAGVHSVEDLSRRDPEALADDLLESEVIQGGAGTSPSAKRVATWVRQAQSMTMGH
jgi:predicted flap endonuclease-1-like 5' DNA nuclease